MPGPKTHERPLSPHLQIYRWQLTMALSILHRMTGAALTVGVLLVAWWLIAAAAGEGAYNIAHGFIRSPIGLLMLFGWTVAIYYHLFNGIRHLIWDTVHLFKLRNAYLSGYIVLVLTAFCSIATWYCAYYY
jgi:succinate dehydrogenase / fumarate reductase cytochrome b subunit